MPKQKTHKGSAKRFKVSASGKVRYKRSFAGHLMSGKSAKYCRKLGRPAMLSGADAVKVKVMLGKA